MVCVENGGRTLPVANDSAAAVQTPIFSSHPCKNFAFPPPPPGDSRRIGPRPCPVCYIPVEQAVASMPRFPSSSPVLHHLTYFHEESSIRTEPEGGSDFGGYPSLQQRNEYFDVEESMTVHCGFIKGCRAGENTGFDIDAADLKDMDEVHDVIVASAIFGNYDIIQQPKGVSEVAKKNIPFFMFVDEETGAYMKNSSLLDSSKRVGLWRIIVVHNVPYADPRRNGKVPKLLLHRLFPNVRYSIWIDGKLQLVVDPYQVLERFLWRQNATFAISRHYARFDVFVEAEANKAAGKYDNVSIDNQIDFYKREGLTPYSDAKLPITSDVPEGCVIIREHIPITNLFTCLWFNEVDRFTARDQLSFSTVRDKIMAKVNWTISMFLDCERRNFVVQTYHRDLLERMPPPIARPRSYYRPTVRHKMPPQTPVKKSPIRRSKGGKRSGSRRHRKVGAEVRENHLL
ncbi:OLC1v1023062C2 [Oldenlandia corymbosa var. corymbosa]|nr:OLC1v1023062C2 [Oldenlandia corymbosa var. corymbosa]